MFLYSYKSLIKEVNVRIKFICTFSKNDDIKPPALSLNYNPLCHVVTVD